MASVSWSTKRVNLEDWIENSQRVYSKLRVFIIFLTLQWQDPQSVKIFKNYSKYFQTLPQMIGSLGHHKLSNSQLKVQVISSSLTNNMSQFSIYVVGKT